MFGIIVKVVKIFYCDVSKITNVNKLIESLPVLRREYVQTIKDVVRKKQSVLVWKLLEHALSICYDNCKFDFDCDNEFCWFEKSQKVKFSLSHSTNLVVVAISEKPIGVDVERCAEKLLKLNKKFNDCENIEQIAVKWTQNESKFKAKTNGLFSSVSIKDKNGDSYIITACHADNGKVEFLSVNLSDII